MSAVAAAWDTHAHVIGDPARYPLAAGATYQPPRAPLEDYLAVLDRCGLAYGVLVQPSVYGFDNSCMLDALDVARDRLFGIAVPAPDATPKDLLTMHERGVRGVRCNLIQPGGLAADVIASWSSLMRELRWHVELQLHVDRVEDLRSFVTSFGAPVVIDHMGRPANASVGGARALIGLIRNGECFVKLSAPYRMSAEDAPWRDVTPLAHALLDAAPAQCVWATDWPHTQFENLNGHALLDALRMWCPDDHTRSAILRDTPLRLFGGAPAS
jgi:2-pyrone-4,6-dicarboxylate lactonase